MMNVGERSEFIRHLFLEDCLPVLRAKGMDYSAEGDANSTFHEIAERLDIKPEQVWYVLFSKHIAAIERYIRDGQVESEPIKGRIVDAINYLAILWSMIGRDALPEPRPEGEVPEPRPEKVLSYITDNPGCHLYDVAKGAGIYDLVIAHEICTALIDSGDIRHDTSEDRGGFYACGPPLADVT